VTTDSTRPSYARAQAIKTKLATYARANALPYERALTLFLLERAVYRLLLDPLLARSLVFKGGYVSVRVYASPRYTTDIDAVLSGLDQTTAADLVKRTMIAEIDDAVWFSFKETIDLKTQNEYGGIRFAYRAGLGAPPAKLEKAQTLHLDLGIGDPVTPAPRHLQTPLTVGEGELSWLVYPVETILSEKLHGLADRGGGSSRSKDIYDLFLLMPRARPELLKDALAATFAYRSTPLVLPLSDALERMTPTVLRMGWQSATFGIPAPPTFDLALAAVIQNLRQWGL
jgi:predicted nucleotidyltransferase component of viral defense system